MGHGEITNLLRGASDGETDAIESLYQLTYQQLQRIARGQRRRHSRPSGELNTTALVHEAFLKFERTEALSFEDRDHFFAVAARAMRQLLVDRARSTLREKRGGGAPHLDIEEASERAPALGTSDPHLLVHSGAVLDLDLALRDLGKTNERLQQVIECKLFAGMDETEIARALSMSERTVRRDWAKARAWLALRLQPST